MGEFVTLWGFGVRDLIKESRWNGTVKNEIAVEKLDFLDRLPASNRGCWRSRTGCRSPILLFRIFVGNRARNIVRVWAKAVGCRWVEHGHIVAVILPIMRSLFV